MAEINVQTKKNTSSSIWLWVLVALIAAAVIYFLTRDKDNTQRNATDTHTTSFYQPSAVAPSVMYTA